MSAAERKGFIKLAPIIASAGLDLCDFFDKPPVAAVQIIRD